MDLSLVILFVVIVVVSVLLLAMMKMHRKSLSPRLQRFFQEHWRQIEDFQKDDPHYAILQADKLLDRALKVRGYHGSLGEKLKKAGVLFSDLNGIWSAHKLRNKVAHELNIQPTIRETASALDSFKKALRDLGVKF